MDQQALPLRDIHLPDAPSYWPLAPGWWIVLVIIMFILIVIIRFWLQQKAKKKIIAMLQSEVSAITNDYQTHNSKHQLAADISFLLRRFTRFILKDQNAATFSGKKWIFFLNSQLNNTPFKEHENELIYAQFMNNVDFDVPKYIATVRNYLTDVVNKHQSIYKNINGGQNA